MAEDKPNDPQTEDTEANYLREELKRIGVTSTAHQFGKQDRDLYTTLDERYGDK